MKTLAWLPLLFFAWWGSAPWLAEAVAWLCDPLWPLLEGVEAVRVLDSKLQVTVRLPLGSPHRYAGVVADPGVHGYGLPVYLALTLVAPASTARFLGRVAAGGAMVLAVQVWGVVFDVLYAHRVAMPDQVEALQPLGDGLETVVVLGYELGVLILPVVAPLLLWALLYRDFLVRLVGQGWKGSTPLSGRG